MLTKTQILNEAYQNAKNTLAQLREELKRPIEFSSDFKIDGTINEDFDAKEFFEQVEAGKKNIVEGDIFQIVISKRFSTNFSGDLLKCLPRTSNYKSFSLYVLS